MAINKVIYDGDTLIDLTGDTVTEATLVKGTTAHNASGVRITGTADYAAANHTHSVASTSANGFMSSTDKAKLDGIASGANKTTVDSALSSSSTNPVQNKVINSALAGKLSTGGGTLTGTLTAYGGAYGTAQVRNVFFGTSKQTAGAASSYSEGTMYFSIE
jgi:hypothetical protein